VLTEEQLEIRSLSREFAAAELRPHAERWDHERALDPDVQGKLAELGLLGLRVPEDFGGLDLDLKSLAVALIEIAWGEAAVGLLLLIHNGPVVELLVRHGSDDQKARFLPALASGERVGAFALSEPDAGSDARSLTTRADRVEGGWRIHGNKRWVTNGRAAGLVVVFAQTDEGVSAFLVDPETPGYDVTGRERTMGLCASETVSLKLDITVGADALLGEAGKGFDYAKGAFVVGRIGVAAQSVGIARAALEHAVRYAGEREQFGHPLADFGAIQEKLATMACLVESAQALVLDVAERFDAGGPANVQQTLGLAAAAAAAKVTASEAAMRVTDDAVQIFGGYGYMKDYPIEKYMRDAKITQIYEGTNQIQRLVIARALMREAASGK
jgi:alkylation response protein AidB-like acyl-CoA dehydrogenase